MPGSEANTGDIINFLDMIAPFRLAEAWDNSGLQAGNTAWGVKKVMVCLDISMAVMEEAEKTGAHLVLSHHPLFIKPEKCLDFSVMPGAAVAIASQAKISIVSVHTNLDKARNGLNDYFASLLGLNDLLPLVPSEQGSDFPETTEGEGIGRVGVLNDPLSLQNFALHIKKKLALDHLRILGEKNCMVRKVAVCTGSGGDLVADYVKSGADVFVTGDMKYHQARTIEQNGGALIDVGHFASEKIAVRLLGRSLAKAALENKVNIEVFEYEKETDPFIIF